MNYIELIDMLNEVNDSLVIIIPVPVKQSKMLDFFFV